MVGGRPVSRCRKLSTDISVDAAVARVANTCGPFAALLYTWAIPHAADDATLVADAEELRLRVVPGLKVTTEEVQAAVDALISIGLWGRHRENGKIMFPPKSFYFRQTYVKPGSRSDSDFFCCSATKSPEKVASFSSSLSLSLSPPKTLSLRDSSVQRQEDPAPPATSSVIAALCQSMTPPSDPPEAPPAPKARRQKAPPHPEHHAIRLEWEAAFHVATGSTYSWTGACAAQLARLLKLHGPDTVRERMRRYLERAKLDPFHSRRGLVFLDLVASFDALASWTPESARAGPRGGGPEVDAALAEIMRAVRSVGRYGAPEWSRPEIARAVRACGGWGEVCASEERFVKPRLIAALKEA
jgi:hypothetical protein